MRALFPLFICCNYCITTGSSCVVYNSTMSLTIQREGSLGQFYVGFVVYGGVGTEREVVLESLKVEGR